MKKVLIIGLGSIGKRHLDNFKAIGCATAVVSRRSLSEYNCFKSVAEAVEKFNPEFAVICNETSLHGDSLNEILSFASIKKVMVEKPLYAILPKVAPSRAADVSVAYNLRFHPMIAELKILLRDQKLLNWNAYVGQYLPNWRPGRDYTQVYSSSRENGGGAVRDLSHEIDLFRFFADDFKLKGAQGGHISKLETDADDSFTLLLTSPKCVHSTVHMNCLDRLTQRFMIVNTDTETYHLDLVQGKWRDSKGERLIEFDRNASYVELAKAFLQNDPRLCSYQQGWDTNKIIEVAEAQI